MWEVCAAVEKGAKLLDEKCPRWYHEIGEWHVYMGDADVCLLANLFGTYERGIVTLGLTGTNAAVTHGFVAPWPADCTQYSELTRAWMDVIQTRRATEAPATATQ